MTGLAAGDSLDPQLEDEFGEANDGPEIEDDPRLDTEVTDESSDLEMGLVDTEAGGVTSHDLSDAEGDEGPEGSTDSDASDDDSDEAAEDAAPDPLEEFRRELWAKPGDWFVVH